MYEIPNASSSEQRESASKSNCHILKGTNLCITHSYGRALKKKKTHSEKHTYQNNTKGTLGGNICG